MKFSLGLTLIFFVIQGTLKVKTEFQNGSNETEVIQYIQKLWDGVALKYNDRLDKMNVAISRVAQETSEKLQEDLTNEFHLYFPKSYMNFSEEFQKDLIKLIEDNVESSACMEIVRTPSIFERGILNWGNLTVEPILQEGRFCGENDTECNPTEKFNELNETLSLMSNATFKELTTEFDVCFNGTRLEILFILSTFDVAMAANESVETYDDFLEHFKLYPMSLEKLEEYDRYIYKEHPQIWYKSFMHMEKWCKQRMSHVTKRPMSLMYFAPLMMICNH